MYSRYMLAWSLDSEKDPLIDERKIPEIKRLAQTGQYTFEPKEDGWRGKLVKNADGTISILKRNSKEEEVDYAKFHHVPNLEAVAQMFPPDTIIDGEGVVMADKTYCDNKATCNCKPGYPCRILSQRRASSKTNYKALETKLPLIFITWDIQRLAGENLENESEEKRRRILTDFVEQINKAGNHDLVLIRQVESEADALKIFNEEPEGIMAKLKTSKYIPMAEGVSSVNRPRFWIKIKHTFIKVFDVDGYCTGATGKNSSMIRNVVITENGEYRGNTGGGFTNEERKEVQNYLDQFPTVNAPFPLRSKVTTKDGGVFYYKPNNGLKVKVAYQDVMPSGIIFQMRMMDLIYPQTVAVAKEDERATEQLMKKYPLFF